MLVFASDLLPRDCLGRKQSIRHPCIEIFAFFKTFRGFDNGATPLMAL